MKKTLLLAAVMAASFTTSALAQMTVGVSWSNFQEERWKTDEAAIKAALPAPSMFRLMRSRPRPSNLPTLRA